MIDTKIQLKLRELRNEYSFTQQQVADKLNVSKSTIAHWELGDSKPSIESLIELSKIFEISLDELVGAEKSIIPLRAVSQELSEREKKILKLFGSLTELEQDKLIADAEFYAGRHSSGIIPKRIG